MAPLRIAFQGEPGAYSEQAALELYPQGETWPRPSFDDVFAAVTERACDYGVVPVENSLAGSIHRNYDLLLQHDLHIVGEHNLRVSHCLIAHPGARIEEIKRIYSHPQALAQCEHSLRALGGVEVIASHDTAGSVRLIAERGERDAAAIASARAAASVRVSPAKNLGGRASTSSGALPALTVAASSSLVTTCSWS